MGQERKGGRGREEAVSEWINGLDLVLVAAALLLLLAFVPLVPLPLCLPLPTGLWTERRPRVRVCQQHL